MIVALVVVLVVGGSVLLDAGRRGALTRLAGSPGAVSGPGPKRVVVDLLDRVGWPSRRTTADDAATVESVARSLRSGASVHGALEEAARREGDLAHRLRVVVAAASAGRPVDVELERAAASSPGEVAPALRLLAVALHAGGESADAVARSAAVVRAEQAIRADAKVQTTQARASAAVISALPVLFVVLSTLTAPTVPSFLFGRPLGRVVLAAGLGLAVLGWWWMRWLTRRVLP
ncbi:MAG: type II secretion system F family protein [Actinomycetota bacterium]